MLSRRKRKAPKQRSYFLGFQLSQRPLALLASRVIRVAETVDFTPVPSELAWNLGVIRHRGAVLPLVALDRLLGLGEGQRPARRPFSCVLARFGGGAAAFPVEALLGFETAYDDQPPEGYEIVDLDRLEALQ